METEGYIRNRSCARAGATLMDDKKWVWSGSTGIAVTTVAAGRLPMALGFSYIRALANQPPAHQALQWLPSVSSQLGVPWSWVVTLVSLRESMDFS